MSATVAFGMLNLLASVAPHWQLLFTQRHLHKNRQLLCGVRHCMLIRVGRDLQANRGHPAPGMRIGDQGSMGKILVTGEPGNGLVDEVAAVKVRSLPWL